MSELYLEACIEEAGERWGNNSRREHVQMPMSVRDLGALRRPPVIHWG